jgi:alkylation response protein AidB-like acyl-CoA dehydrogenase
MEFELTEEQLQMKMSVREFAEAEIAPHVMEWDEAQHFPIELMPKLGELGLLGILFPKSMAAPVSVMLSMRPHRRTLARRRFGRHLGRSA